MNNYESGDTYISPATIAMILRHICSEDADPMYQNVDEFTTVGQLAGLLETVAELVEFVETLE